MGIKSDYEKKIRPSAEKLAKRGGGINPDEAFKLGSKLENLDGKKGLSDGEKAVRRKLVDEFGNDFQHRALDVLFGRTA